MRELRSLKRHLRCSLSRHKHLVMNWHPQAGDSHLLAVETLEGRQMLSATPELLLGPDVAPRDFTPVGDSVFFTTFIEGEVWVTDGTQAGTMVVADIDPGRTIEYFFNLTAYDDQLVFGADDGSGFEPWISDGTFAGTVKIKDINSSGDSLSLQLAPYSEKYAVPFTLYQGELYFAAEDDVHGHELWKTDGTEAGTVMVADILSGSGSSYAGGVQGRGLDGQYLEGGFVESGGTLFFGAHTDTEGFELWKTDGTQNGTMLVKDIRLGSGAENSSGVVRYRDILQLTNFNDTLFFVSADSENDFELWKSDGTEAGTVRVKDVRPGIDGSYPTHLTVVDDSLFFFAQDGQNFDLWKSDGSESGTVLVKDFTAGTSENIPNLHQVVASDGTLFFSLDDGTHGRELWKSDGTEAGTVMVADIYPGSLSSEPYDIVAVDGGVVFRANDGTHGEELWASDGTTAGTYLVADLVPGSSPSFPREMVYTGGKLYFAAANAAGPLGFLLQSAWVIDISLAPVADIGGPYSADEGESIVLSAESSTGNIISYEWDFDNDGQYDDATGESPTFIALDDGVYPIGMRLNGPGGPTDTTTVTVANVAPTAAITGTSEIYRGETVTFTLDADDLSAVDQAELFTFEIDWDGNGTVDETVLSVPSGTPVQRSFSSLAGHNIQIRATDKNGATGGFGQLSITVSPHVLRDDGFGNTDLIWGGTSSLDAVYVLGQSPALALFVQIEGLQPVNRLEMFGSQVTGRVILHGYDFADILIGELASGNRIEIHGGDGDDIIVGGSLSDDLYGEGGNDVLIGGTRAVDGDDFLSGGAGVDTLFGHYGADTLDGGAGEDLLISDRFSFSNVPNAVQQIANEWKSPRPYSERVSNILGVTSTGLNGAYILDANATIVDDGEEDVLLGGIGDKDWFFYDFDQDLLGDTIEIGELETDSDP